MTLINIYFAVSRTCVNGSVVRERTKVNNGDRILWGNNHFFRVNTPVQYSKLPPFVTLTPFKILFTVYNNIVTLRI